MQTWERQELSSTANYVSSAGGWLFFKEEP